VLTDNDMTKERILTDSMRAEMLVLPVLQSELMDREVRRLFMQLSPIRLMSIKNASVESVRRSWQLCVKAFASRAAVAAVLEKLIPTADGDLKIRIYSPKLYAKDELRPALVWFHGGGFVFGDLYTAGATCRQLANRCGCAVIAVEYRLAPESSLQDGLSDCVEAFRWVAAQANGLGIDPDRLAIGGDSAGGALAALVAQKCKSKAGRQPAAQMLVYPATDLSRDYSTIAGSHLPLAAEGIEWLQSRISRLTDLNDPAISPLLSDDLAGLPPAIVLTAGFDPLREEALAYARRLASSGVSVRLIHFPGQFHGFLSFDNVLQGAREAFDRLGSALTTLFDSGRLEPGVECAAPSPASWRPLWLHPSQRLKETAVVIQLLIDIFKRNLTNLLRRRDADRRGVQIK
jgi:acetyl esterase